MKTYINHKNDISLKFKITFADIKNMEEKCAIFGFVNMKELRIS